MTLSARRKISRNQWYHLLRNFNMNYYMSLLISRKEKEQLVIKLAQEGKTTREIAKQVHVSLRDIGSIIHKESVNKYTSQEEKDKELEIEKQKKFKSLSPYARAFQMFKD